MSLMNTSCSPIIGFFDTPEFLATSLHTITVISTPIHVIGLYCIIRKTPVEMKSEKWCLLNLHIWLILFDYSLSFLTIPIVLIPAFAGYPMGFLRVLGMPAVYQFLLGLLFLANVATSIVFIFENRFFTICTFAQYSFWKWLRHIWLAAHFIGIVAFLAPFGFFIPDQNLAKHRVFQTLPCLPRYIYEADITVIADEDTYLYPLFMVLGFGGFAMGEVAVCIIFLMWNTAKQLLARTMSERTFGMQKKFFMGIMVQISVPLLTFCIPFLYAVISVVWKYYNQSLNNFFTIIGSLQGSTATLVMIFVHRPYRRAILSRWFKKNNSPLIGATKIAPKSTVLPVIH